MTPYEIAKNEVELACKRENPNWDGVSFDYGCGCYQSALKAFKSICEDGHSGYSYAITKNILIALLNGNPLVPITDDDFELVKSNTDYDALDYFSETEKKEGLISKIQCPRMSSLFRKVYKDGRKVYSDINRWHCQNVENPKDVYINDSRKYVDEFFPIEMPYKGTKGKYIVVEKTFLCDRRNGDFDHKGVLYIKTPDGEIKEIGKYFREENGSFKEISKEEFELDEKRRIDIPRIKNMDGR